ncbi:TonB-dependent receptor [Mucilaginibacter sp.]|jgi:TonB-linked SusC/RagA family outer membrane protein|uniref:SusC/RagA family TonB-linked outer membrane protein n=1 Tax=Mucilaginibacter sp. TaxID=1882438 RepID=UPI002D0B8CE8|nr:TonB-dependent receptor [Mucilaginibacter sp.]HTI58413.1 TonB-dependent receptor [Mucilaginibacter sp.]
MIQILKEKFLVERRFYQRSLVKPGVLTLFFVAILIVQTRAGGITAGGIPTYLKSPAVSAGTIIKGVVLDESNAPVPGATVAIKKIGVAGTTDVNGRFQLNVPPGEYDLYVSYIGMKPVTKHIIVGDSTPADIFIVLPAAVGVLNEVVVVGYGSQSKRNVTGSIVSVKGEDLKNLPVSNPADALQGRASGVDIVRNDGAPGGTPSIRIRGTGTINNADPLVIIDGVPAGGLNDVNANDIATIDILKDASASAIYGSRAANGVVIITTKKGNFNEKLKTSVNLYAGENSPVKFIKMLTAPELAKLKIESYTNDDLTPPTIWANPYYSVQRTDWQRALMGTGHVQNADFAVRGGNTSSVYSFSGNYYNETGMIPNSLFTRYNFRVNSEHKVTSRIKVGENILYSNSNNTSPDTRSTQAGLVWSAIRFNPAIPVMNPDGSYGSSQADNQLGDINNPVATARLTDAYNKVNRLLANGYAEVEIVEGLKIKANYAYDNNYSDYYNFQVPMPDQTRGPSIASLNQGYSKGSSLLEEYFLTYNKIFNNVHEVTLTGGYSAQLIKGNYVNASRSGFTDIDPDQRVLNLGNSANNSGNNNPTEGLQSYFVRGNYAYNSKYLLTVTMRADGSSKFAPGKQWGYFPAFSAGWRISDENFYGDGLKNIFSSLKLTGGWGQLGNQNIGNFQYLSTLGYATNYGYALGTGTVLQSGAFITGLANPNITWERASETNIALEFSALKEHLTGSVTYFNKNTTDMLIPYQLVETFGAQTNLPDDPGNITLPNQNIGEMNNHGIEIDLNYHNNAGKLKYSFGANASFLKNKVTKLYGQSNYIGSTSYGRENVDISRTYEGQSIASFYGFKTNGLYQTQADIDNDPNIKNDPNKGNIKPGDVRFLDLNGDGVVDDKDRTNLGNPNPKVVFGVHGSLAYKNFDFAFNFAGEAGFKLYNADRLAGLDGTQVFNWYAEQEGRWHGQGTSNTIPRLSNSNLNNNYRSSDMWVENGTYIALKSVSLGYTFAKKSIADVQLPDIRVYVSSYNVFTITGYKGYTPELGYTSSGNNPANSQKGVDVAQYPSARNVTFGVTANF